MMFPEVVDARREENNISLLQHQPAVDTFKLLKNVFGIDGLMKLKNIFEDLAHHLHC